MKVVATIEARMTSTRLPGKVLPPACGNPVGDIRHDPQAVAKASLPACRHVPRLLMYRSNWYHSPSSFTQNFYVDISDAIDIKEKAILAHISEVERTGRKWMRFFRIEAENAGQRIGVPYAEAFELLKWLE